MDDSPHHQGIKDRGEDVVKKSKSPLNGAVDYIEESDSDSDREEEERENGTRCSYY